MLCHHCAATQPPNGTMADDASNRRVGNRWNNTATRNIQSMRGAIGEWSTRLCLQNSKVRGVCPVGKLYKAETPQVHTKGEPGANVKATCIDPAQLTDSLEISQSSAPLCDDFNSAANQLLLIVYMRTIMDVFFQCGIIDVYN